MEQIKLFSFNLLKNSITHFEDLSNELIYEIFDFLDFCHVYTTFSNLNKRFENLLTNSSYPIKMNLSYISKSTFRYYHTNIIIPYQHRIQSLHLFNPYLLDTIFSPISVLGKFTRLESLIINTIHPQYLHELLDQLQFLPNLHSLVIMSVFVSNRCQFYHQIFHLPVLKYCKLSIEKSFTTTILPFATTEFSPIEYLVVEDELHFMQLNNLLSYVPQLHHLSCHSCENYDEEEILDKYVLNHLTHVSLKSIPATFDKFESLIKNLFYQVEVLHISIQDYAKTYIDANRWKRLILSYMPHLRIFDIMLYYYSSERAASVEFIALIEQFNSSFWIERQWFFEYQIHKRELNNDFPEYFDFYSINPYRRKKYTFRDETLKERCPHPLKRNIVSAHDVLISDQNDINDCMYYFPNATELTVLTYVNGTKIRFLTNLSSIIPLTQLTKLVLYYNNIPKIIELLRYTPNIHTFEIFYGSIKNAELESIHSDNFGFVSKTNNIKKMSIMSECTFELIEYFLDLCPRLEHLAIEEPKPKFDLERILRFLLSKDNRNTGHLFSLRIRAESQSIIVKLQLFIYREKLLDDFLCYVKHIRRAYYHRDLYLWW